jgi:DNA polymerase III delta prime subunit
MLPSGIRGTRYTHAMQYQAFVIEAEAEKGIEVAHAWVEKNLHMKAGDNPDVVTARYGLFSVEDARKVAELASGAPFVGEHKVVIIAASRAYHEAQNALLKLFEEPPRETYLFLILPSLGGLLPTLRSRVHILSYASTGRNISDATVQFVKASKEKRTALIKRLTSGKDEDQRRENREEAIQIVNDIEMLAYEKRGGGAGVVALLQDLAVLRGHLYDRSAPVRMILEHIAIVLPKNLL